MYVWIKYIDKDKIGKDGIDKDKWEKDKMNKDKMDKVDGWMDGLIDWLL